MSLDMHQNEMRAWRKPMEQGKEASVENEKNANQHEPLPLYEWDRLIVHPAQSQSAAYHVAARMCIGVGYAESRYIAPYVAIDLLEW